MFDTRLFKYMLKQLETNYLIIRDFSAHENWVTVFFNMIKYGFMSMLCKLWLSWTRVAHSILLINYQGQAATFFLPNCKNRRLWNARWQQTYQVNVYCYCCQSSEPAHITENNGFYLVSLLPPNVLRVSYSE